MTALLLDAGALIALDRNDRSVWAMLRNAADDATPVFVPAGVIAQAWRHGSRRAFRHLRSNRPPTPAANARRVGSARHRMTGIVGEWTPIRSQAKVQSECLVELMQQRKVQVPHARPDAVDIDRSNLLGLGLRRLA